MSLATLKSPRMRVKEVAAYLRCSVSQVYVLTQKGLLHKYNDGPRFSYWLRSEVEAFANGQMQDKVNALIDTAA